MEAQPTDRERMLDDAAGYYREHRNAFIAWAKKKFGADQEEAKDAFQEALCSYYELKRSGRLNGFTGEVRTYLFAIGRNQLLSRMRSQRIAGNHSATYAIHIQNGAERDAQHQLEHEETLQEVRRELEQLDAADRRVLELYYIERLDMKRIAEEMGYKNSNVAKKKKCIAMKRLMEHLSAGIKAMR